MTTFAVDLAVSGNPHPEKAKTILGALAVAVVAISGGTLVALAPFATPPAPHRTAGILFDRSFDDRSSVSTIFRADPNARLVEIRWHGRLVFVTYENIDFPAAIRRAGALYIFDAVAAGCHPAGEQVARR